MQDSDPTLEQVQEVRFREMRAWRGTDIVESGSVPYRDCLNFFLPAKTENRVQPMNMFPGSSPTSSVSTIACRTKSYCFCIKCLQWVDYDEFKEVPAKSKTITQELTFFSFSSHPQARILHPVCSGRWIVGDIGLQGMVTGPVELVKRDIVSTWENGGNCSGPDWLRTVTIRPNPGWLFWVDATTNHEGLHFDANKEFACIAVRILEKRTFTAGNGRIRNIMDLVPKGIVFVNVADIATYFPDMQNFFESTQLLYVQKLKSK